MKRRSIVFYLLLLLVLVTGLSAERISLALQSGGGAEGLIAIALLI